MPVCVGGCVWHVCVLMCVCVCVALCSTLKTKRDLICMYYPSSIKFVYIIICIRAAAL